MLDATTEIEDIAILRPAYWGGTCVGLVVEMRGSKGIEGRGVGVGVIGN